MLCDVWIRKESVIKEIKEIKKTKSPGDIYPLFLKEANDILFEPLVNSFRKSLDTRIIPHTYFEES